MKRDYAITTELIWKGQQAGTKHGEQKTKRKRAVMLRMVRRMGFKTIRDYLDQ